MVWLNCINYIIQIVLENCSVSSRSPFQESFSENAMLLAKNGRKYEFFAITTGAQGWGPSFLEAEDREAVPEAPQWVAVHVTLPEEETQRCYTWGESRCPDFKISVYSCLYNYNGSFAFSFYFILSLRQDCMLRKRLTKKDERMRPKMRELHELPSKKLGL